MPIFFSNLTTGQVLLSQKAAYLSCHIIKLCRRTFQFEGLFEGSIHFAIRILHLAYFEVYPSHPPFTCNPLHTLQFQNESPENKVAVNLSNFTM